MKNKYLMAMVLGFVLGISQAQVIFTDDMEWNTPPPHWGYDFLISDFHYRSPSHSGYWDGSTVTDGVLDLGNQIFGTYGLAFWMYIPAGKEGYFNFQGQVPIGAGEWIVGNIYFNEGGDEAGSGYIDFNSGNVSDWVFFNYPEGAWFQVVANFDISSGIATATWQFYVNAVEVIPQGSPLQDASGTVPTSLGGADFYSISANNEFYLDDFLYQNGFIDPVAGVDKFQSMVFILFPNPTENMLTIESEAGFESLFVYNLMGQTVLTATTKTIDVSNLPAGVYFVEVRAGCGKAGQKFIKE